MSSIGVYSEWGRLKEVIVGCVSDNAKFPPLTHSQCMYLGEEMKSAYQKYEGINIKDVFPNLFIKIKSQVEELVKTYEKEGVKVYQARSLTLDEDQFLDYLAVGGESAFVRDPVLVVGKTVIELGLKTPYRRKEIFGIREILQKKIAEDPEVQYISMPQPLPVKPTMTSDGPGPFLEGGDIFVMGQNILVGNSGLASNKAGIMWLSRILKPEGFNIHEIPLKGNWLHLDCVLSIIRPGLCTCYAGGFLNGLPEILDGWEVIQATSWEAHALGCNTMCLDENKILIGAEHTRLIEKLKQRGVKVETVPMEDVSGFGGSIRCLSHPLVRE